MGTRARASTRCGRERRTEMIGETERDTLLRADKIVDVEGEMPASGDLQHPATGDRRAVHGAHRVVGDERGAVHVRRDGRRVELAARVGIRVGGAERVAEGGAPGRMRTWAAI